MSKVKRDKIDKTAFSKFVGNLILRTALTQGQLVQTATTIINSTPLAIGRIYSTKRHLAVIVDGLKALRAESALIIINLINNKKGFDKL